MYNDVPTYKGIKVKPLDTTMSVDEYMSCKKLVKFWLGTEPNSDGSFRLGDIECVGVVRGSVNPDTVYVLEKEPEDEHADSLGYLTDFPNGPVALDRFIRCSKYGYLFGNTGYKIVIEAIGESSGTQVWEAYSITDLLNILEDLWSACADAAGGYTDVVKAKELLFNNLYSYHLIIEEIKKYIVLHYGYQRSIKVTKELILDTYDKTDPKYIVLDLKKFFKEQDSDILQAYVLDNLQAAWDMFQIDPFDLDATLREVSTDHKEVEIGNKVIYSEDSHPYFVTWDDGYSLDRLHDWLTRLELQHILEVNGSL